METKTELIGIEFENMIIENLDKSLPDEIKKKLIDEVLQKDILKIESDIPLTLNNYDKYLAILSYCNNKNTKILMAYQLILNNANKIGVLNALKLCL